MDWTSPHTKNLPNGGLGLLLRSSFLYPDILYHFPRPAKGLDIRPLVGES